LDLKVPPSWGRDLGRGKKKEDKAGLRAKIKFFNMKPPSRLSGTKNYENNFLKHGGSMCPLK